MRSTFGSPARHGDLAGTPGATLTASVRVSTSFSSTHTTPSRIMSNSPSSSNLGNSANKAATVSVTKQAWLAKRFPEKPTKEEKLRLVFDEIDAARKRYINEKDLQVIFKNLNINFTAPTVSDLFQRADVPKSNVLNFSNFLSWAEHYPTLIDAIYYRSRGVFEQQNRMGEIESGKDTLGELSQKERAALAELENAAAALADQHKRIAANETEIATRNSYERDCHIDLVKAQGALEQDRVARNNLERDLQVGQESEKRARIAFNEKQDVSNGIQNKLDETEKAMEASKERERELQALLSEAQHNTMQLGQEAGHIAEELDAARGEEKVVSQAYYDVVAENERLADAIASASETVEKALYNENEAKENHAKAIADLKKIMAEHQANLDDLNTVFAAREAEARMRHTAAARIVEAAEAEVRKLENDFAAYLQNRSDAETAEQTLLEGEVRLREQRYNLDDRDGAHVSESTLFSIATTVGSRNRAR